MIIPIILAGGKGTRLWPLSNEEQPKQFLSFIDESTLLQNTLARVKNIPDTIAPIIIGNAAHRFILAEQAQQIQTPTAIMLEPEGRNTAPSIVLSALYAAQQFGDPILLVLPSDHYIDFEYFASQIPEATMIADEGKLITFGITPTSPKTEYGYIKKGHPLKKGNSFLIEQFVEKPNLETAKKYMSSGDYYWNSGMFLFKAASVIEAAKKYAPELLEACKKVIETIHVDQDFIRFTPESMQECPSISFDYAIMEKTEDGVVLPFSGLWTDLGNWKNIWEISEKDKHHNAIKGHVMAINTNNSYISSTSRLVVTLGINNQVIVETPDAVLVASLDNLDEIKQITEGLSKI